MCGSNKLTHYDSDSDEAIDAIQLHCDTCYIDNIFIVSIVMSIAFVGSCGTLNS